MITRKQLFKAAREEVPRWSARLPNGLVMAVLFSFIHYVTTGETVEETYFQEKPQCEEPEYFI